MSYGRLIVPVWRDGVPVEARVGGWAYVRIQAMWTILAEDWRAARQSGISAVIH
jgi:hypothetical protein